MRVNNRKIKVRFNIYIPFGDIVGSGFGSAIEFSVRNFVSKIQFKQTLIYVSLSPSPIFLIILLTVAVLSLPLTCMAHNFLGPYDDYDGFARSNYFSVLFLAMDYYLFIYFSSENIVH